MNRSRLARLILVELGILPVFLVFTDAVFAQCSMCRRALVASAEGERLARGFNSGILFLLVVPFLILGVIAFLIYTTRRRDGATAHASLVPRQDDPGRAGGAKEGGRGVQEKIRPVRRTA